MQLTFEPARLTGLAILAVAGATALSLGACSSSPKSPEASPASPGKSSAGAKNSVSGLIASVSGNAVQVTEKTGTVTVDVSPKTRVTENVAAQLTDITAGKCVHIPIIPESASAPGGAVTARTVQLSIELGDGKCPTPPEGSPPSVNGRVASVAGDTINVTVTDANGNPSETRVGVTDTTRYWRNTLLTSEAIVQGKCIAARGTKGGSGTLQATVATLSFADKGKCP